VIIPMRLSRNKFEDASPEGSKSPRPVLSLHEIQEKKRRRRQRVFFVLGIFVVFVLSVFLLKFIIWSPWFKIKNFEVSGAERLGREDIVRFASSRIIQKNFWRAVLGHSHILSWPGEEEWDSLGDLAGAQKIEVSRDLLARKIWLRVEERQPIGIWCAVAEETEECAWFDALGVVLSRAPAAEGNLIPVVRDYTGGPVIIGQRMTGSLVKIQNLTSVFAVLRSTHLSVAEVRLEQKSLDEARVVLNNGPELYFSLRFAADNTKSVLKALADRGDLGKLEYVDFRIENRAYYK